jgi:MFS family permease
MTSTALARALLPLGTIVFIVFLMTGLAMPVLPLHVHNDLGMGAFMIGLIAGSQFAASLVSRIWAGNFSDQRGPKPAVLTGLVVAALAGLVYLLSLRFTGQPALSSTILVVGRGLLGAAESFIITGALGWGLALGGAQNAGRVIAWMGMPMFAAFALGAPLGSALYAWAGFSGISLVTMVAPLAALLVVWPLQPVKTAAPVRSDLRRVLRAVRWPGLGLALSSFGFGSLTIFIAILFLQRGWSGTWMAFTGFSLAFIAARMMFGHLPDRIGGAKVAFVCVFIEAAGQAMIWFAHSPGLAIAGAALTGLGYSLIFPALGVEAVRRAPPSSRALVMGSYTACLDLTLGLAGPGLGLVAAHFGVSAIFLLSAALILPAALVAFTLMTPSREQGGGAPRLAVTDE